VSRRKGPAAVLAHALASRKTLVVCGAGGVGKTTTAAALALRAALGGRRVLVCTIDPSRRLATSLGLVRLSDRPRTLSLDGLGPGVRGTLSAMMLDTKRAFDALVERYSTTPAARRRILGNHFYRHVSAALAGSHEYMAMEKLLELSGDPRYDLVVLDTPPTRHALDFLEAPDRLLGFLDTSILRYFLKPYFAAGRLTLRIATRTGALALKLADSVLGLRFLQDLSEFFLAFEGMYDGFKERAARVHALLRGQDAGFVLVASPSRSTLDEARFFHRRLVEKEMPFVTFVVNRVHQDPALAAEAAGVAPRLSPGLREKLVSVFREQHDLAEADRRSVEQLGTEAAAAVLVVPELETDVHDLRGLARVADALLGTRSTGRQRARRRLSESS
jgi:anion-transporting  ArsA/GET3 family ATPase